MKMSRVWMRLGDNDDYHSFDSPFDAGVELGIHYERKEWKRLPSNFLVRHGSYGVSTDEFSGYNYISLFWGDDDANPEKSLTNADLAEFLRGVRDGADIPVRHRKVTYKAGAAGSGKKARKTGPSGIGVVR